MKCGGGTKGGAPNAPRCAISNSITSSRFQKAVQIPRATFSCCARIAIDARGITLDKQAGSTAYPSHIVMQEYMIYAALYEDVNQGWVWIGGLPADDFRNRSIVRLSSVRTGRTVYCELLTIDSNFISLYNYTNECEKGKPLEERRVRRRKLPTGQSVSGDRHICMSQWYREKLSGRCSVKPVRTNSKEQITIKAADHTYGRICACLDHPQVIVRISMYLGLLGAVLGLVGFLFSILSFFEISFWKIIKIICS